MRHLNERHTWFNLDKNNEGCILRYTTKDGSMLGKDIRGRDYLENLHNEVIMHKYGCVLFKEPLTNIDDSAFIYSPLTSINIPNTVKHIGEGAFRGCAYLKSINIPEYITRIEEDTFAGCNSIEKVTLHNGITYIGVGAFQNCLKLKSIVIPGSVGRIEKDTFNYCTSLSTVTICNGVTELRENAFYFCARLTTVTIPNSVTVIGQHSFNCCKSLTDITYEGTIQNFKSIVRGYKAITNATVHCTDGDITIVQTEI